MCRLIYATIFHVAMVVLSKGRMDGFDERDGVEVGIDSHKYIFSL